VDAGKKPPVKKVDDWNDWHDEYDDPDSELAGRARGVRRRVAELVTACTPGPVTVVSICGGQGREVIGALADHPRRADVRGRLVELDPGNAEFARRSAEVAGLTGFAVVNGDASAQPAYAGLPPVDVAVVSGLFGHLDDDDQVRLISFLRSLLRPEASVVWTFFLRARRRTERLRNFFAEQGFEEVVFDQLPGEQYRFTVAVSRHHGDTQPRPEGDRIFTFGSSHAF